MAPVVIDPAGREDEDPVSWVFSARIVDGAPHEVTASRLPRRSFGGASVRRKQVDEPEPNLERDRLHPLLRAWVSERDPADREELLVVLRENLAIPRFPEPAIDEPRDSGRNRELLARSEELVEELTRARADALEGLERRIDELGGRVLERFWLINGALVELSLGAVERLADTADVVAIDPRFTDERPPQDEVDDGRALIDSDLYFNLGQTGGWIGLLDTGVRFTHTVLTNPSHIDFRLDCVNGGASCNTGTNLNPGDTYWNHGTSSAAILVGNGNQGNNFRGVTAVTLDSFQTYTNSGLDTGAAVRAFQRAVEVLDRVIIAEIQGSGDHGSSIAQAADAAYDAGAVVIAANGNYGPKPFTVACPANAHRVLGVGNVDVQSQSQQISQGRGPTADGRVKPDIQAPTNTETASNATNTAHHVFTGTSGATPYAAGAATLLRNWLRGASATIDPGQVYAQMILSGQHPYPFDNTTGAGLLRMPTNGITRWGKVSIGGKQQIDIPFEVTSASARTLDAAIWWPEHVFKYGFLTIDEHNDIDLFVVSPSDVTSNSSISSKSVFERVQVQGPIAPGFWRIRIVGYDVTSGSQTVYWAACVHV